MRHSLFKVQVASGRHGPFVEVKYPPRVEDVLTDEEIEAVIAFHERRVVTAWKGRQVGLARAAGLRR